jgi:hypothetical protein
MHHRLCAIAVVVGCGCAEESPIVADAAPDDALSIDALPGVCGDGVCSLDESSASCCGDCGICSDEALVTLDTGVANGAPGASVTPGGMAASFSDFAGGAFTQMTFPIEVVDPPVARAGYFWAQTFYFGTTDQTGYTGLQSGSSCGGGPVGKRVIFSIWDATAAVAGPHAHCETFGGEGVGYHCCAAFDWREDVVYRLTVHEVATGQWQMELRDPTVASDLVLGTITASTVYGRLTSSTTGFVEYFTQVNACTATPHARARLYRPSADNMPATHVQVTTYGTCMQQATATCIGSACL